MTLAQLITIYLSKEENLHLDETVARIHGERLSREIEEFLKNNRKDEIV